MYVITVYNTTYKICVNQLLMVLVRILVKCVLKFWGSQKLHMDFQLCGRSVPLTPEFFKGQLYITIKESWCYLSHV